MAVDVIMPQMGESIFEGTITKWLKKPGDKIERDEPLFEISTDKVDAEIPSPSAGVLKEIKVNEGQTVPIQTIVAMIDADGAARPLLRLPPRLRRQSPSRAKPVPERRSLPNRPPRASAPAAAAKAPAAGSVADGGSDSDAGFGRIQGSQLAAGSPHRPREQYRSFAGPGTGAGGRVSKRDILAAVEGGAALASPPAAQSPSAAVGSSAVLGRRRRPRRCSNRPCPARSMYFGHYEVQPMSVMRQQIAEHMVLSKRVSPHVYSVEEVDVTAIAALRAKMKDKFEEQAGTKLTFMPFFIRAAVEGLRAFPTVNSSVDGTNVVLHKECNIGVAVALDWGLIVPVIKNAEEKNFLGLARAMNDLAERARTKKLKPEEVAESTFLDHQSRRLRRLFGLPVINQPNVAILGLGAIEKRPVVIDDAIAIRSMVYLTLSYDHRVVDGAVAHQFMGKVKHTLENWTESIL